MLGHMGEESGGIWDRPRKVQHGRIVFFFFLESHSVAKKTFWQIKALRMQKNEHALTAMLG